MWAGKRGAAPARTKSRSGGGRTARKGKQGIVSWLTSIFSLIIGLFPFWTELGAWVNGASTFGQMGDNLQRYYNPLRRDNDALKIGYGSLVGGLIFKVVSSELTKRARITSIVPALHA